MWGEFWGLLTLSLKQGLPTTAEIEAAYGPAISAYFDNLFRDARFQGINRHETIEYIAQQVTSADFSALQSQFAVSFSLTLYSYRIAEVDHYSGFTAGDEYFPLKVIGTDMRFKNDAIGGYDYNYSTSIERRISYYGLGSDIYGIFYLYPITK